MGQEPAATRTVVLLETEAWVKRHVWGSAAYGVLKLSEGRLTFKTSSQKLCFDVGQSEVGDARLTRGPSFGTAVKARVGKDQMSLGFIAPDGMKAANKIEQVTDARAHVTAADVTHALSGLAPVSGVAEAAGAVGDLGLGIKGTLGMRKTLPQARALAREWMALLTEPPAPQATTGS